MTKNPLPIKAVIFDLGNVLIFYDARKSVQRFAQACGVSFPRAWHYFFTSPSEKAYTRGEITCRQFYEQAREALRLELDFETFRHYWTDIFWENEEMDALLSSLAKRYPLYLLSNTNKMHFDYIKKNFDVLRHFRKTFPSHEVGARKPDRAVFERVLTEIGGLKPDETVFIDDAPEFVRGAREADMHAIRFRNRRQLIEDLRKLGVEVPAGF